MVCVCPFGRVRGACRCGALAHGGNDSPEACGNLEGAVVGANGAARSLCFDETQNAGDVIHNDTIRGRERGFAAAPATSP